MLQGDVEEIAADAAGGTTSRENNEPGPRTTCTDGSRNDNSVTARALVARRSNQTNKHRQTEHARERATKHVPPAHPSIKKHMCIRNTSTNTLQHQIVCLRKSRTASPSPNITPTQTSASLCGEWHPPEWKSAETTIVRSYRTEAVGMNKQRKRRWCANSDMTFKLMLAASLFVGAPSSFGTLCVRQGQEVVPN